jgi:hypothetical protein
MLGAIALLIIHFTGITIEELSGYVLMGILYACGIIGGGVVLVLIIGMTMKEAFTNIFCRADHILVLSEDKKNEGVHIISDHYFSGGEGDGYNSYYHYFIDFTTGKLFLSKKIKSAEDSTVSINELSDLTKKNLSIDLKDKFIPPSFSGKDDDTVKVDVNIRFSEYKIHIKKYDNLLDYGFRISCFTSSGNLLWKKKI